MTLPRIDSSMGESKLRNLGCLFWLNIIRFIRFPIKLFHALKGGVLFRRMFNRFILWWTRSGESYLKGQRTRLCYTFVQSVDQFWTLTNTHLWASRLESKDKSYRNIIIVTLWWAQWELKIIGVSIACSTVCSDADHRKRQRSAHGPLWRESIGDRWIPLTKASNAGGICFHLMTSSWYYDESKPSDLCVDVSLC